MSTADLSNIKRHTIIMQSHECTLISELSMGNCQINFSDKAQPSSVLRGGIHNTPVAQKVF